jgi:hypothetical protein
MRCSAPVSRWFVAARLSSLVAALVLLDGTQAQADKGKKYALLVGVRAYDHRDLEELKGRRSQPRSSCPVQGEWVKSKQVIKVIPADSGRRSGQ